MKWKPFLASILGLGVVLPLVMLLIGTLKANVLSLFLGLGIPAVSTTTAILISRKLYLRVMFRVENW